MTQASSLGDVHIISDRGPKVEMPHAALTAAVAIPATIAGSGTYTSPLIPANGFYDFTIGVTSTQAGTLTLLRYIDDLGQVALDSGQSTSLVANTAAVVTVVDGKPCAAFQVKVANGGGSAATVSGFAILAASH
jgi:hypothetical protein